MAPSPQLAPPGSSTYSSDTMYVGDGTWDSSRNSFLLPNLLGLNFETMRYNGMGNRFRDMPGYKSTIRGHGIVAAIVFLLVVPAAIMIAKFFDRNPRLALRLHIWLQVITVFLVTAAFALGWLAVGPARSLTNPHHGIGLAIYVMVLVQVIWGSLIHRTEKGRDRLRIPLKLFLHQWLGRSIALLGFVQVALGLTLYGSPKVLFILYALWGVALLLAYLILSFLHRPAIRLDYNDGESYITDHYTEAASGRQRQRNNRMKYLAAAGAAGAGLAAMRRRSRSRRRSRDDSRADVISSRHSSPSRHHSHYTNDKYSETHQGKQSHSWRDRLVGAAAGAGAMVGLSRLFGRKPHDRDSDSGDYRPPLGGNQSITQTDVSRIEDGRPPESPDERWRRVEEREHAQAAVMAAGSPSKQRPKPKPRRSGGSLDSFDSRSSTSAEQNRPSKNYTIREGVAALGLAGYIRHKLKGRRERKEEMRIDEVRRQDVENERIARANSQRRRYTGDGTPRRGGRRGSDTATSIGLTGSTPELSRHNLPTTANVRSTSTNDVVTTTTTADPSLPPPPLIGSHRDDSGSEAYYSTGGTQRRRHHAGQNTAAPAIAAAAPAIPGPSNTITEAHRDTSAHRSSNGDSLASPPVSVKVKMHNDGRHVTLRRLNEEEAKAEREARRHERRKNRANSLSSQSGVGEDRWRRTAQSNQDAAASAAPLPVPPQQMRKQDDELHFPPPPPIPASSALGGSISSPPGTNTDVTSNYDSNRRRRRAERAAAKQARGGGGSRVEFT